MPAEKLTFSVQLADRKIPFSVEGQGIAATKASEHFNWVAPKVSGLYRLRITPDNQVSSEMLLFVMRPATDAKNGKLDGYAIGAYPAEPYKGSAMYEPPLGFFKVTEDLRSINVSPNYTLGQFLCKQKGNQPKYLILRTQLLNKLEFYTAAAVKSGFATGGFVVMSGFRTPHYNKLIGSKKNSRHLWGGAADIYIDESPKDNVMDDINGDGKFNEADAIFLADFFEKIEAEQGDAYRGGLSSYKATKSHGPFVHIDARGYSVRW